MSVEEPTMEDVKRVVDVIGADLEGVAFVPPAKKRNKKGYQRPDKVTIVKLEYKLAFQEVCRAKERTRKIGFQQIANKYPNVSAAVLRKYWSLWMKGQLDPGVAISVKYLEISSKDTHERQLSMLKRWQFVLMAASQQTIELTEKMQVTAGDVFDVVKQYNGLEVLRALKFINEMIMQVEKGYLAILDEYHAKLHAREVKAVGGMEVHSQAVKMNDEMRALAAMNAPDKDAMEQPPVAGIPITELVDPLEEDVTQEDPEPAKAPAATEPRCEMTPGNVHHEP